jgi:S-adenosyl-L-methionine hydrolase (adenosine-forming)
VTRVVLLTDFGTADGYAAAMSAIIATASPGAVVEHATHEIPPGDIFGAAFTLARYASLYPPGTVHLAVVDPGVGSARRALAATIDDRHFVGPDNGLFTLVLQGAERVRIVDVARAGRGADSAPTFHGRDIFAPAAAHLAAGRPLEELGPPVVDPVLLDVPRPDHGDRVLRGHVLQVDRFGNLITNIPASLARAFVARHPDARVRVASSDGEPSDVGPLRRSYSDVAPGNVVALVGSVDLVEVSIRDGHAAGLLRADRGCRVEMVARGPRA